VADTPPEPTREDPGAPAAEPALARRLAWPRVTLYGLGRSPGRGSTPSTRVRDSAGRLARRS